MAFDKGKPIAGRKARYIDDDIRANNEAIEAAVGFGHDFATGSTQTGEHNDGAAKIYSAAVAPTTKEDGVTALNADDVGKRLWLDTSVTPNVLKVLTAIGSPNTWTSIAQLMGMLDEDDMASDSDTLPATQQSVKAYVDGLDAENIKKDGSVAFTGNQSMGFNQLTDLPDPSSDNDAARKKYVDDGISDANLRTQSAASIFGPRTTKDTDNATLAKAVIYRAECDGFLYVQGDANNANITVHSNSATPPSVQVCRTGYGYNGGSLWVPIRKLDYVEVNGSDVDVIAWIPIGTGGLAKQ